MTKTKPSTINRNGWTDERRKRQSQAIRRWKPWQQSTGAKTPEGKAVVAQNAFKGGIWAELMLLQREAKALLKEQRDFIGEIKNKV